jgi:hypothetical protein
MCGGARAPDKADHMELTVELGSIAEGGRFEAEVYIEDFVMKYVCPCKCK